MDDLRSALLALQQLDNEIARASASLEEYAPQLAEIDRPVATLETEIATARTRLEELRAQVRRLESAAEMKRHRLKQYETRMERVRNAREEAAARTEIDLIRRAVEADETEALELMEQATRTDLKVDDLEKNLTKARAEIAPRKEALLNARTESATNLGILQDQRENHAIRLDKPSLRLYERVRAGRAAVVLAPMTAEGACGHCFNTLPLQEQSEIRLGSILRRCEACGVILYAA
ncbi:MAG: zinc ribbon domain-containing protein [Longimicrobiales bacterium]